MKNKNQLRCLMVTDPPCLAYYRNGTDDILRREIYRFVMQLRRKDGMKWDVLTILNEVFYQCARIWVDPIPEYDIEETYLHGITVWDEDENHQKSLFVFSLVWAVYSLQECQDDMMRDFLSYLKDLVKSSQYFSRIENDFYKVLNNRYGCFHTDLAPNPSAGLLPKYNFNNKTTQKPVDDAEKKLSPLVPSQPQDATSTKSTREVMEKLHDYLSTAPKSVSTLQAKCQQYATAIVEMDNALSHLKHDKTLIDQGIFVSLGNDNPLSNYSYWIKTLRADARLWSNADLKEADLMHYAIPGFDFEPFVNRHQEFEKAFQERMKAIIDLLKKLKSTLPTSEQLIGMYDALENEYNSVYYPFDHNEYKESLAGIPKSYLKNDLKNKLNDLENQLNESKFFHYLDDDPATARQKLCGSNMNTIDKESVARYIFGHRSEMTNEMIVAFFRYEIMGQDISKDLKMAMKSEGKKSGGKKRADTATMENDTNGMPTFTQKTFECKLPLGDKHLNMLYQALVQTRMIADTSLKDFIDFFSGEECDCKIKWVCLQSAYGTQPGMSALKYFINRLKKKKYAWEPKGEDVWIIVRNHFVDRNGKPFSEAIRQQAAPKKLVPLLNNLVELLNPNACFEDMGNDEFSALFSDIREDKEE